MLRTEEEKMNPTYFHLIFDQLVAIERKVPDQQEMHFELLLAGIRFLKTFCWCLKTWDYTTDNEESMETYGSMTTYLKVIWLKEHKGLSLLQRIAEIWPIDLSIQDFHSIVLELEAKIQQSNQLVEGWCQIMLHSSMHSKSSTLSEVLNFLNHLQNNLIFLTSYRADKIVPLKKQFDILIAKIVFLKNALHNVECCPYGKEILQFLDFVGDFAKSAACLTCLYWIKEADEETATEMNIVLFDSLQKFIPCASDITPLYVGILKYYYLHPPVLLKEAVECFVDFFFEHLATTLNDEFIVLRDHLMFLFTFLTEPPCENEEEEYLIRSQIHALLCEDAYLLLSFDLMKEDFSNKRTLLSDCMIKIDTTIAKIRQLYCGFSDSWIRSEVEKMEYIYFVSVQRELSWIEKHAQWVDPVLGELQIYVMELRFLRMFLLCFATWDDTDEEIKARLSSMITSLQEIWETKEKKGLLALRLHAICMGDITDWYPLALELEKKIELSKLEIEAWGVNLFHQSFRCKPTTSYKILKFLNSILQNLNDLVSCKASEIVPFKMQIETLEEKLLFLRNFLNLTVNCIHSKELEEFVMFVQVFTNDAACLTFLYWAKDANDKIASETDYMFSLMRQKIKPATPDVARLYFATLREIYLQRSDSVMFGQTALDFVDLFLENLLTSLKNDFQILRDDIVFLLTFLNDPPDRNAEELMYNQIDVNFWEDLYALLPFDDMEGDFSKKKAHLGEFMVKIDTVNANIREICCKFPDSSMYNFPKTISPQFLDFLIQNLKNLEERMISDRKYVPFAKYIIIRINEELVSFCPFFNHIFDLQREENETWLEVVNLVHLTEHVINSCISSWSVFDHPFWYHMAYLYDVFDGIKIVKTKVEKFKENAMYDARCLPCSAGFTSTIFQQARPSEINDIVVGFEDEEEKIIGMLKRGHMPLDIVSIVGMGGSGKTTLAKKVYGSSSMKLNFDVFAFCYVSQDHDKRRLLLDILRDIKVGDDKISDMTDDDLAHLLWKCLSRQKYLIVLDDIWNVSSWNEVKNSFPDDKNGSRIMFTTRSHDVAKKCKISCSPHQLRFLSEVESWELLQKKIFHNGISPPYIYEIGKVIANNCKGLPLAICVIASLLARTEKSLRWWSEVAENLVSYLYDEGCMKILELSYMHLPKKLKPCLLYLGAFPEDMLIRVEQVILLWIAEGFVQESKTRSLEDVAKEYFHDLVDRSLIIVSARSSNGEIKTFRVHDLIRDLCQAKCRDGNFFLLNHKSASSTSSNPSINNHYRVSMQKRSDVNIVARSSLSNARSLLIFFEHHDYRVEDFSLRNLRLAHLLDSEFELHENDIEELSSLVHLRHVNLVLQSNSIPSSISNLWNLGSLWLSSSTFPRTIRLPETFWKMKSLRHVKVNDCFLKFPDGCEHKTYPTLDKVVSFSKPFLSTGKDVQQLLQRLPAVRKLSCCLKDSPNYDKESMETLNFYRYLESLKLRRDGYNSYLINFPSTLKNLTLVNFQLPWTAISAIAELHCLQVLKLKWISFPEPRLDMEDMTFRNLKFFELHYWGLEEWNASTESLPCLEQFVIECLILETLPACFGEISTLKRIVVRSSLELASSAHRIQEEQMELGNEVEVLIYNRRGL